jgi:sulfur carrier protein
MKITVNNKSETFFTSGKLVDLLGQLDLSGKSGIAVAVNNNVVTRSEWEKHELKENDQITIIRATQGG